MTGRYKEYPEYKESGIEWLEKIPTHWSSKALKFLCTYNDEVINETTDPETIIEYVDIGSVSAVEGISKTEKIAFGKSPSRARRIVRNGDVIVSTVRTYLEAIAPITNPPENMIVSTGFAVIRPNSKLDKGFAAYCLRAKGFIREVVARSVGISYPAINATELVGISVPYLPYEEQQKIANFLDHETAKIDTLISKQEKLIELLKEKRQAVISHAVTKGLNPQAPMKDSGVEWLGEVPEHWVVGSLRWRISISSGEGIPSSLVEKNKTELKQVPVIGGNGVMGFTETPNTSRAAIAIGRVGALCGNVHLVNYVSWITDNALKVSSWDGFDEYYLVNLLKAANLNDLASKTAQPLITGEQIKSLTVVIPPIEEQVNINLKLTEIANRFDKLEQKSVLGIELLKERKTALISAAVTGKIDVRDWETK